MEFIVIRKPFVEDAETLSALIRLHADKGVMLPRDEDEVRNAIDTFLVAEFEGKIIGSVSRYDYGKGLFEIRSLVVTDEHGKAGIGSILLQNMIKNLIRDGAQKIFALSYSPDFFRKNGFAEVTRETLPEKIWKDCRFCKNADNCGETALVYIF